MKRGRGCDFAFALVKSREVSSHPVIAALEAFYSDSTFSETHIYGKIRGPFAAPQPS